MFSHSLARSSQAHERVNYGLTQTMECTTDVSVQNNNNVACREATIKTERDMVCVLIIIVHTIVSQNKSMTYALYGGHCV